MSNAVIEALICPGCYAVLDAKDNYCRHCGVATARGGFPGRRAFRNAFPWPARRCQLAGTAKLSESPWVILPLLFLILGPFALPLLWRSHRFTLVWKYVLTILMFAVTAALLWSMWFTVQQALAPLQQLDQLRGV